MAERESRWTRDEMLSATFTYLVEHGLENTSVRDMCKKMKISFSSMYYLFEGKEDIFINAAKVGTVKVVSSLFDYVHENIHDIDKMIDGFLAELDKHKKELRLIFQMTASPVYGEHLRQEAEGFKPIYALHIKNISKLFNQPEEEVVPIIFLLVSIVVDYIIWEDTEVSTLQLNYLRKRLSSVLDSNSK